MNVAVIFAGGTGQRMNTKTKPKQFLELHGIPILVHTLENFERHNQIDGVVLVILSEYIDYCQQLARRFQLRKVRAVVPGGKNGQSSIYHGLIKAKELYPLDSTVLIHDGVRPLIDEDIITKCIDCVERYGNAITVTPAIETIAVCNKDRIVKEIIDRSNCQMARAPQCFILKDILAAHERASLDGLTSFIDSACLMMHYGHTLYTVEGPAENIKITTPSDFYILRAMMDVRENSQIFGI